MVKKIEDTITHCDTIHERDRQQDGRTDRQTPHDGMPRLCVHVELRGKIEIN